MNFGNLPGDAQPTGRVFQMLWDCRFCGTKKLLGVDHRHCPNCGGVQDPAWRYFPSDEDKREVNDPNYRYAGVDKMCPACGQPNSAAAAFCAECGTDLSEVAQVETRRTIDKGSADDTGEARDLALERFQAEQQTIKAPEVARRNRTRGLLVLGAVIGVVGLIVGALIFLSRSTVDIQMQVSALSWERSIHVERLTAQNRGDWRDQMAFGSYNESCYTRDRPYQVSYQEQCGTERVDRGDGTGYERPRMCTRTRTEYRSDTWCDYTVNTWVPVASRVARGGPSDAIVWPAFTATGSGLGSEKEVGREEKLNVTFTGLGEHASETFAYTASNEQQWRSFMVGQSYTVKRNLLNQVQWETLQTHER